LDNDDYKMNIMRRAIYSRSNSELEVEGDLGLDDLILNELPVGKQYKTARIISRVCDLGDGRFSADEVANRLVQMANEGKILAYGNMSKWACSEVRMADAAGD